MKKERRKSKLFYRNTVIGIDETNNGLGIPSKNPNHQSSLIVTGYLGDNSLKKINYQGSMYENKCGIFGTKIPVPEILERGKQFLYKNPHFFYTAVPKEFHSSGQQMIETRAETIALLTFRFILSYGLNPSNIQLIIDQIDGPDRSKEIGVSLEYWLQKTGLNIPYRFIRGAENIKISARKADRVGYWLAAIHFLGKNHKWPYKHRRINLKCLESLAFEVIHMRELGYPLNRNTFKTI